MTTATRVNCVLFATPDGNRCAVTVNGEPKGDIVRIAGTQWAYDHDGLHVAGAHMDVRRAIKAHYDGGAQ